MELKQLFKLFQWLTCSRKLSASEANSFIACEYWQLVILSWVYADQFSCLI